MMPPELFQQKIQSWFDRNGRKDLPWQQNVTPYFVWVSEIMLQQTQVKTVIPYFVRFTNRFQNVESLAEAPLDQVLQYWSGLGYYARARNLHRSAIIIHHNNGKFPETIEAMIELPGVGRSTAGAILSIACQQSHPILDGNVKRVLARFEGIHGWPGDSKTARKLWQVSERNTPKKDAADYTQAMMDLGATVCTRSKPKCNICPLNSACFAFQENKVNELPTPRPRKKIPTRQVYFLLMQNCRNEFLLQQRPSIGIWGGLWSLPEFDSLEALQCWCVGGKQNSVQLQTLSAGRHTFSHFVLEYTVVISQWKNPENIVMEANRSVWYKPSQIDSIGLPAPIKRVLQEHYSEENI